MRKHLMPMDIIVHEGKMWIVSTAHETIDGEPLVNINGYKRKDRKEQVLQRECKIIEDMENRPNIEISPGLSFYPDTTKRKPNKP